MVPPLTIDNGEDGILSLLKCLFCDDIIDNRGIPPGVYTVDMFGPLQAEITDRVATA